MAIVSTAKTKAKTYPTLPDLSLIKQSNSKSKYHPVMFAILGSMILCSAILYRHTVFMEWKANQKQQAIIQMKEGNDHLQASLAELKTLPEVEAQALALGMKPVTDFQYIKMKTDLYHLPVNAVALQSAPKYKPLQTPIAF